MLLNSFYNPYLYTPSSYGDGSGGHHSPQLHRQRAEALAAQRARRARYLPTEDVDSEEDDFFEPLRSRERAHLDTRRPEMLANEGRRQRLEELRRQEAARLRQTSELEAARLRQAAGLEAARLRQASELERNRREQARRLQQAFGKGPTVANHVSLALFL